MLGALVVAAVASACAAIMGVDEVPTLSAVDGGGASSSSGDVVTGGDGGGGDGGAGCRGEGCLCTTDAECSADPTYKSCVAGKCAECTTQPIDNCPDNKFCLATAGAPNACAPGCKSDRECATISPTAPFCNTTRHQCVQCLGNQNCVDPLKCSPSGTCAQKCGDGGLACPPNQDCCSDFCVDLKSDILNCGGCGMDCKGTSALCCNSQCKASLTDVDNCGACGTKCSTVNGTPSCGAGNCKWVCNGGFHHCSTTNTGCETSTSANPLQCGSCTTNCNTNVLNATGVACAASACTYATCNSGFYDNDTNKTNGCESNVNCPAPCATCAGDVCQINCGADECNGGITCPPGRRCKVTCSGQHACQGSLTCPPGFPCIVECLNASQTCDGLNINATGSSLCLRCDGASEACKNTTCQEPATGSPCKKRCGSGSSGSACNNACGNCGDVGGCTFP